ncbi:Required for respiratory growth [Hyphodiscus hymeniophilus]|uniref:Required for respiratory growth protein 9, mitochondrial n=1 Tax=Hyphodiscus hymeniophilus TaxID=353542 RepID=A0A9P6SL47_9HELO|nr:Required for respiratory growth [Hyphodiscus hymeniophilus]
MSCLCPTNTLKLFIRSVAQVELPASKLRTSHTRWHKPAIRSFSSTRQHSASSLSLSKGYIPFETSLQDIPKPEYGSQKWAQGVVEGTIALRHEKIESAQHTDIGHTLEGQPEAATTTTGNEEVSSKIISRKLRKERRRGASIQTQHTGEKPREGGSAKTKTVAFRNPQKGRQRGQPSTSGVKPTFRVIGEKNKVYDSGFKIHYSAPIAPESARPSKLDTKPRAKSMDPVKENKRKEDDDWKPPTREHWQIDKDALKAKFPDGWRPLRRLSPDALSGIRALHAQDPVQYTTAVLANSFEVSPEAMRRILKSKWSPKPEEESDRLRRWNNRGKSVYSRYVELGVLKPPKKWRDMGIGKGKPEWMVKKQKERKERAERGETPLPALIATGRARDAKYGLGTKKEQRVREPLPALVTTRRVQPVVEWEESLKDRIL